ncbi:MAG: hypothetical protein JXB88_00670 [Spirochaetales bacterium]|nr:hypothetical protein [Spirochaetales bacterium]
MKNHIIFILIILIPACNLLFAEENFAAGGEQEWKAIIAFFPGPPEEVTEDWVFFLFDVEEYFKEDEHIYFIGIFLGDDAVVPIIGPENELIANVDISGYIGDTAGYIFIMRDKAPLWCDYMPSDMVIKEAERYFYNIEGDS